MSACAYRDDRGVWHVGTAWTEVDAEAFTRAYADAESAAQIMRLARTGMDGWIIFHPYTDAKGDAAAARAFAEIADGVDEMFL